MENLKKEKITFEAAHNAAMSELLDVKLEGMSCFSSPSARGKHGRNSDAGQNLAFNALQAQLIDREAEIEVLKRLMEEREDVTPSTSSPTLERVRRTNDTTDVAAMLSLVEVLKRNRGDRRQSQEKQNRGDRKRGGGEGGRDRDDNSSISETSSPFPMYDTDDQFERTLDPEDSRHNKFKPIRHSTHSSPHPHPPNPSSLTAAVAELYEEEDKLSALLVPSIKLSRSTSDNAIGAPYYDMDLSRDESDTFSTNTDDVLTPPRMHVSQGRPLMRSLPNMTAYTQGGNSDDEARVRCYIVVVPLFSISSFV